MPSKLTIAFLIDTWFPFYGGGQVHVKNLRQQLESQFNCHTELFYAGRSNILIRFFWSVIVIIQVLLVSRRKKFNLIHSHGFIAGLPAKILSGILKIPVVHTVHGSHLMDQKAIGPRAWLEKVLLTKIHYDGQITVASNFLNYPNVNTNIKVIPNGVNLEEFNAVRVKKNPFPTLIWVGRDHPDKGLAYLKEAILKVRKKLPTLHAELVTGGSLTGTDLVKAYKRAHVFVLPSLAEGQPITLLEAWAAKLPVIVTPVGDNPKMVKPNINGFLVEPANTQQLARTILKVLRSKKASRLGLAGYRLVKQNYTWSKVARQTYAFYQTLLE
jgi:glycosyltransferase involved in cell wall biosynthesis